MHRLFFYLLIFFLPTQLGFHYWPESSLVLGRRIDFLSPTLFFTDMMLLLTIFFWWKDTKTPLGSILIKYFKKPRWLLLIAGISFHLICSTNPLVAGYAWIKVLEYTSLIAYIYHTKPSFLKTVYMITISIVYTAGLGVFQSLIGRSVWSGFWYIGERSFNLSTPNIAKGILCFPSYSCIEYLRSYATLPHPNVLGGFLVWYLLLPIRKSRAIIFLVLVTLCLTFSRSAWIALGITLCIRHFQRYITKTRVFMLLCGFLVLTILPFPFIGYESVDTRVALNQAALLMIRDNSLFGVGLFNFMVNLPNYLPVRTVYFLQPVHNIPLLITSELGLIGLLLIGFAMWKYRSVYRHNYPLIAFCLIGFFDHYLITLQQGQLLLAITLALPYFTEKPAHNL